MKLLRRLTAVCLAVLVTMSLAVFPAGAAEAGEGTRITVLFTHDMHSHLLPAANGEGGGFSGGYARLKAVIDQQRALYPDALLVDGLCGLGPRAAGHGADGLRRHHLRQPRV